MSWNPLRRAREARALELELADRWRVARKLANDDVTALGEEIAELHVDTLGSELDDEALHHYRRALDHYDQAKERVRASQRVEDVLAAGQLLQDSRYHRAAVLALQAGEPLPARREPCFFDPRHGPSVRDLQWTPPAGVERTVPVCATDARRLEGGAAPETRMVRVGDRHVPVHEAGGVEAIIERHRTMAQERSTSHNKKHLAEAYINQSMDAMQGGPGAM
ncbi:MAG: putative membrane protein [uncultured Nocardioides sp.]|uniref:Putative membrane protein n=1 Tax=uncultured Nocardioides sp. TaxID=198441 RepID=A0A6J4NE74_9ACTN|nr:MAG: putative membrane protein [uncultured Nocardioides sp.]